jgi:UDP-N-acetylmuramoylalanine--D-glutamate ligase
MYLMGKRSLEVVELQLRGLHNMENCLAAAAVGLARGLEKEAVLEGLRTFAGVAHRLERAGIVGGVTYVNDSKATNVEATLKALDAYPERTHLILGGRDKASDYKPVARACAASCKAVYLIGEATPLIEADFREVRDGEGRTDVPLPEALGDLENAVRAAAGRARSGDTVLLAPACASFDQYDNFEERGEHFRAIVLELSRSAGKSKGS